MKCLELKNQLALCYSVTHRNLSVGITPKTYISGADLHYPSTEPDCEK